MKTAVLAGVVVTVLVLSGVQAHVLAYHTVQASHQAAVTDHQNLEETAFRMVLEVTQNTEAQKTIGSYWTGGSQLPLVFHQRLTRTHLHLFYHLGLFLTRHRFVNVSDLYALQSLPFAVKRDDGRNVPVCECSSDDYPAVCTVLLTLLVGAVATTGVVFAIDNLASLLGMEVVVGVFFMLSAVAMSTVGSILYLAWMLECLQIPQPQ